MTEKESGRGKIIRRPLAEAPHAYEIFRDKKDNCVKVVLKP